MKAQSMVNLIHAVDVGVCMDIDRVLHQLNSILHHRKAMCIEIRTNPSSSLQIELDILKQNQRDIEKVIGFVKE